MRLTIQVLVLLGVLYSCQMSEVSSDKTPSSSGSDKRFEKVTPSSISNSGIEDPNSVEPEMPGSGETGGDITLVMPQSPVFSNASPLIPVGQASTMFTPNGLLSSDLIAFGPASVNAVFPFPVSPSAARVWMGFSFKSGAYSFVVRGYPLAVSNGSLTWKLSSLSTQVVGVTSSPYASYLDLDPCVPGNCGTYAVTQGQVTVSELSINAQGKVTLKASVVVSPGGIAHQINKVGYLRHH